MEAHVNIQPGSVGKDTKRTRKDILDILPKDLTKEQVDTARKTVKMAVMNGCIFDGAERKKLLKCRFAERYKEIIRTMEDNKASSEINDRMIEKLDRVQEQWVQSDFEGIEYYPVSRGRLRPTRGRWATARSFHTSDPEEDDKC
jgi:hypothetical protein